MAKILSRIVCISDTHIGAASEYSYRGFRPVDKLNEVFSLAKSDLDYCDAVLHIGDVCGDPIIHPDESHYLLARQIFAAVKPPIVYIAGNHDRSSGILHLMNTTGISPRVGDYSRTDYTFDLPHLRVLALDSSDFTKRAGVLSDEQLIWIHEQLDIATKPVLVIVHHPINAIGCNWIDTTMLLAQGEKLHAILVKQRDKVLAVLSGHIHDATTTVRNGIPYYTVPSTIFSFGTSEDSPDGSMHPNQTTGYMILELLDTGLRATYRLRSN